MNLGLSKDELELLGSFGKTPEEKVLNLYGPKTEDWTDTWVHFVNAMRNKTIELILANNSKVAEQLEKAGIKLPE